MTLTRSKAFGVIFSGILGFSFAFAQVAMANGGERIESFAMDITVRADGMIDVAETIEYVFPDGGEERHGIYRDIPTRLHDDTGKLYEMPLGVRSVTDGAGSDWPVSVTRITAGKRLKIGDKDETVTGTQTYAISYEVGGALRYFPDNDELYWNATGNDWTVPIVRSSATVHLPESVPTDSVTFTCYTGTTGSTAKNCVMNRQGRNVSFAAQGPLTVVVSWAPGIVAKLLPHEVPTSFRGIQLPWLPPTIPVLVFVLLFAMWVAYGRDPSGRGTIVVQYEEPDEMRPAEIGTLMDGHAGNKEISATIVDLAVRGYLEITETPVLGGLLGKQYRFNRTTPPHDAPPVFAYEQRLLETLFHGGRTAVTVAEIGKMPRISEKIEEVKKAMYAEVMGRELFTKDPNKVRGFGIALAITVALCGVVGGQMLAREYSEALFASVALSSVATGVLIAAFGWAMPRRTPAGVVAREHAIGFREYLSKAEKYRLQWQEKEGVFEKFLPYAIIYGVVGKWAKAFEGTNVPPPVWFHGASIGTFDAGSFASSIGSLTSNMSSSGASGGSSGGGGGGGGGGSW